MKRRLRNLIKFIILYPSTIVLWLFQKLKYGKEALTFKQVKVFLIRDLGAVSLRRQLKNKPYNSIEELDVKSFKKSDTIFIFGSGSSLNDLTEKDWENINQHDSISMNFSFIESKIKPTFVFNEFPPNMEFNELIKNNLLKRKDYRETPHIFQYANIVKYLNDEKEFLDDIISLLDYSYIQMPYYHPIPNKKILKDFLNFRKKSSWLPLTKSTLIHHLGSINMILNFVYLAGYKKVVLLGVDMKDHTYFYQNEKFDTDPAAKVIRKIVPKNAKKIPHGNAMPANLTIGYLPGYEYIPLFNDVIFKPEGVDLYIGSKKALLYPELPYYFEDKI